MAAATAERRYNEKTEGVRAGSRARAAPRHECNQPVYGYASAGMLNAAT